jgi:hypothetical protein
MTNSSNVLRRHPLLIPRGDFCYRIAPIDDGVEIKPSSPRLGLDFREASFGATEKMVLCPYWVQTNHGTVRCDYLKIEVPSQKEGGSSDLADKLKACGIRPEPTRSGLFASLFSEVPEKKK